MTDSEIDAILRRGRARMRLVELVEALLEVWDGEWTSTTKRMRRLVAAIEALRPVVKDAK